VLVASGGPAPRDASGRPDPPFRVGDVIQVECPFAATEVDEASPYSIGIRWPWVQRYREAGHVWNGEVGFSFKELHVTPFRVEPDPATLRVGDCCRVGIPPTVGHVVEVHAWYPDRDLGWLPGESVLLTLLPPGVSNELRNRDREFGLNPYGPEPIRVELLLRPYAALEDLDVVADRDGRRWEFYRPYWWVELDRDDIRAGPPETLAGPAWPLALRRRGGVEPTPAQAEAVARATADGSHEDEMARWRALSGVEPVAAVDEAGIARSEEPPPWEVEAEVMRVRDELAGWTFSEILRAYLRTRAEHRQLALAGREFDRVPDLKRMEVRLKEIASIVRELRSQGSVVLQD
jgi:hypothetical protein